MDKQFQDIHINNNKTHVTNVIREVTIKHIIFETDYVTIEYQTNGIYIIMKVPKPHYAITID